MPGRKRGERSSSASGKHDYEPNESLAFWRPRWHDEFVSLPPSKQAEQREHMARMLQGRRPSAALLAYAASLGIGGDDGN